MMHPTKWKESLDRVRVHLIATFWPIVFAVMEKGLTGILDCLCTRGLQAIAQMSQGEIAANVMVRILTIH